MAKIAPYVFVQELDNNGDPLAGGKLFTYDAGTTTNKTTFTTEDEATPNANPIILDSAGRADIWLGSGSYKFVLKDVNDVTIKTVDNITGAAANVFGTTVQSLSTNTNVVASFRNNVLECTAALTLTLLSAVTAGEGFVFSVKNSSAGNVIIDPDSAELVDGAATKTIGPDASFIIVSTGTAWITFAENYGTTNANNMTFSGANTHSGVGTFSGVNTFSAVNTFSSTVVWGKGADIASAGTLVLGTDGNYFDITGTVTVTSLTVAAGTLFILQFDDALILTHDATNLDLPGEANITTASGDTLIGFATGTDTVQVISYTKADGQATIDPFKSQFMQVQDVKATGVEGGSSAVTTWNVRTLNTVVKNDITGASLASNKITLPAGTYRFHCLAPAHSVNGHQLRIFNVTDTSTIAVGRSAYVNPVANTDAEMYGEFTIAAQKDIRLDHFTVVATATVGLGRACDSGESEKYAEVRLWKL